MNSEQQLWTTERWLMWDGKDWAFDKWVLWQLHINAYVLAFGKEMAKAVSLSIDPKEQFSRAKTISKLELCLRSIERFMDAKR